MLIKKTDNEGNDHVEKKNRNNIVKDSEKRSILLAIEGLKKEQNGNPMASIIGVGEQEMELLDVVNLGEEAKHAEKLSLIRR